MSYSLVVLLFAALLSLSVFCLPMPCGGYTPSTDSRDEPTPSINITNNNGPFTGGFATYFYQNGSAGACGWYNLDSAIICAMDQARFGTGGPQSPLCGLQVQITNMNNGQQLNVTIADDCPSCQNSNSIDLSVGAFQALDPNLSDGQFPIEWSLL